MKKERRDGTSQARDESRHRGKPEDRMDYLSESTLQERSDSNSTGREERASLCGEQVSHTWRGKEKQQENEGNQMAKGQ